VIELLNLGTLGFAEMLENGGRIGDGPGDDFADKLVRWIGVSGGAAIRDKLIEVECSGHDSLLLDQGALATVVHRPRADFRAERASEQPEGGLAGNDRGCGRMNRAVVRLAIAAAVVAAALSAPAVSQKKEPPAVTDSNLEALARQPDCKEFRNACQVCARLADGKLGCSNIGVACNPSGPWQCSVPSNAGEPKK
jgi:hypothetical protein